MKKSKVIVSLAALGMVWEFPASAKAGQRLGKAEAAKEKISSALEAWWNGKYASGNWLGLRDTLEDHGLKLGAEWKANFLWNVDGGLQQRFGYDDEWKFRGTLDFAKLTGWEAIEGLTAYSDVRYRGGAGVNRWIGSSSQFAPSTFQGGRLWRFQQVYLTYITPELFGIKELLTLSGGWQNPTDIFISQPLNKFFINNTFTSDRGIRANGFGWGGSYAAWGGYIKLKPLDWYYLQSGLYMAIPGATSPSNHGLFFAGAREHNGLYWLTETGFTPKIGPSKLAGRYAAGFIYWGVENTSFFGQNYDQQLLFYWQADQQLYREPSPPTPPAPVLAPSDGKVVAEGKEKPSKPKLSEQGLYFFSLIGFAPQYNNPLPFYFHAGLVYKGLIPGRDQDQVGVAFAYGNYSFYKQLADERSGRTPQVYEAVLEFDYRLQVNKWFYAQPLLQYIIRPNGTGLVENATVLGFQLGVIF